MSYGVPSKRVTSLEIEEKLSPIYKQFNLNFGRLELATGISERRVGEVNAAPSVAAVEVAKSLLNSFNSETNSKIRSDIINEIDLLIYASVCRDYLEPATAATVHAALGLKDHCLFYDLSNACLGVMSGVAMASELLERGSIRRALIVASENSGPLLDKTTNFLLSEFTDGKVKRQDLKKHFASFTIGSGAYAILLTADKSTKDPLARIIGGTALVDTAANFCTGGGAASGMLMETDAEALLQAGVTLAQKNWELFKDVLHWESTTPQHIITHQVGVAHQNLLTERLGLEREKIFSTFSYLGNTGSVALPITLNVASERGLLKNGEKIALLGIGSGLSSIMLGLEWLG